MEVVARGPPKQERGETDVAQNLLMQCGGDPQKAIQMALAMGSKGKGEREKEKSRSLINQEEGYVTMSLKTLKAQESISFSWSCLRKHWPATMTDQIKSNFN